MKKIAALLGLIVFLVGCQRVRTVPDSTPKGQQTSQETQEETERNDYLAHFSAYLIAQMQAGQYPEVTTFYDSAMEAALPADKLAEAYEQSRDSLVSGDYLGASLVAIQYKAPYTTVDIGAHFSTGSLQIRFTYNEADQLSGLFFTKGAAADAPYLTPQAPTEGSKPAGTPPPSPSATGSTAQALPPEGVVEYMVSIPSQPGYPLKGCLTTFEGANGGPSAVLIAGSGPQDMDETIGPNKPLRDIAWQLAERGITTLRFDKITYAYANELREAGGMDTFDIHKEIVEDSIAAVSFLRKRKEVDADRVYLLGHSLGAMVAPDIDRLGGNVKGFILLAGTPKKLWEIQYAQNLDILEAMEQEGTDTAEHRKEVEAQKALAQTLLTMSDEQAVQTQVFGVSAWYARSLEQLEGIDYLAQAQKPTLILQGGRDFQVTPANGIDAYRQQLGNASHVQYKLFPELSHLFGAYSGPGMGTVEEYNHSQPVDRAVTEYIATALQEIP